ncbi:MAG: NAD-dependent epimerase/dehydratase family protein [Flavobacterium sp.]|nr:MAG: NAD-dependent epimerase/dehydratase family protein [Flavobacterium sp.]
MICQEKQKNGCRSSQTCAPEFRSPYFQDRALFSPLYLPCLSLNLVESIRILNLKCKVLSVGSSEEYGVVNSDDLPLTEESYLNPVSPYAVARVSQELLSKVYVKGYGLDIVMTRSFNHIGPTQKDNFVISSFAKQIVLYKRGMIDNIEVGNLDIIRDFLDVRDVVKAYTALMDGGIKGEIYNICSNHGYSLKEIVSRMMSIANVEPNYIVNPKLVRPVDNPVIIGSNDKIKSHCGWQPVIPFEKTLEDIISYWSAQL